MVISVSNNISESSINDFFHNTEIAVLELCNQAELDAVRSSFLNEADEGGEEKNSKFAKFITAIKLKIEQLARKVTDTIQKQMVKLAGSKAIHAIRNFNKKNSGATVGSIDKFIKDKKADVEFYNPSSSYDDPKFSDCTTVDDFMKASKSTVEYKIQSVLTMINFIASVPGPKKVFLDKDIDKAKKEALKQVKNKEKDKSIEKEEAIKEIKLIMNWYTAEVKCVVANMKTIANIVSEYTKISTNVITDEEV